jgi:hypothetical protein
MNRKELLETGWVERKEFWIKKGEFGTWLMSEYKNKPKESEEMQDGDLIKRKKGD